METKMCKCPDCGDEHKSMTHTAKVIHCKEDNEMELVCDCGANICGHLELDKLTHSFASHDMCMRPYTAKCQRGHRILVYV